jgi:ADP-ribose pyrophosphatase YjhB (NUDIX family)
MGPVAEVAPVSERLIQYCPYCGVPVERRLLFGEERATCLQCGWIHFQDPKVAAGVLVERGNEVLLVQRGNDPGRGLWSFPAGFVDAYEDPARAAERECLEETGLVARVTRLLDLISGREHPRGADIVLVYAAEITGGELLAGDDATDARFFPRDNLPPLAFRATRRALGLE